MDEAPNPAPADPFATLSAALNSVKSGRTGVGSARDDVGAAQAALARAQTGEAGSVETLDAAQKAFDEAVSLLRAGAPDGSYWATVESPEG